MPLKFYNIRSREVRVAETEPMIAAMYNSSDRGPNAGERGQDFGWRLAPEIVVQLRRIMVNERELERIASRYRVLFENVDEKLVLKYISDKTPSLDAAPVAQEGDYEEEYRAEIRKLENAGKKKRIAEMEEEVDNDDININDEGGEE